MKIPAKKLMEAVLKKTLSHPIMRSLIDENTSDTYTEEAAWAILAEIGRVRDGGDTDEEDAQWAMDLAHYLRQHCPSFDKYPQTLPYFPQLAAEMTQKPFDDKAAGKLNVLVATYAQNNEIPYLRQVTIRDILRFGEKNTPQRQPQNRHDSQEGELVIYDDGIQYPLF